LAVLQPYSVRASVDGLIASTLRQGSEIGRGALLGRIQRSSGEVVELRSPLPGKINTLNKANGSQVNAGDEVLTLNSDEESVYEALRGLSLIGKPEDVQLIQGYAARADITERVRQQAQLTINAIKSRAAK